MDYDNSTIAQIFEPVSRDLVHAVKHVLGKIVDFDILGQPAKVYALAVYSDGGIGLHEPRVSGGADSADSLHVQFLACTTEEATARSGTQVPRLLGITVPLHLLTTNPAKYFMYHVGFAQDVSDLVELGDAFDSPLVNGYIGITKRNPIVRFREHRRSAVDGTGHLFHKTWNSLLRKDPTRAANFMILGKYKSIDEAYAAEEMVVDKWTLAPRGLNAIPGGMKGIRMMHQLRLLNGTHQISVEDRDRALVRLEGKHDRNSPCAHYRTGHFRNLPSGKMTWVSPCWVNPSKIEAALEQ